MRASGLLAVLGLLAALAAPPAAAQPQTPSEDNLGVRTEDGRRTTDPAYNQPQANIGAGGGPAAALGGPGAGSAAAVGVLNQLLNGGLAGAPLLPPAQNPLLGRWRTTSASAGTDMSSIGPLGQMSMGALAGGCDSMFGRVVTFGPASFERVGADGRAQVLRNVEYHGEGATIAVLVKGSQTQPTVMRLADPDHAVSAMGCTLQRDRSGGSPGLPAAQGRPVPGAQLANAPMPPALPPPSGPPNATLRFQVGVSAPGGFTPLANATVWMMTQDPLAAMAAGGFAPPPGGQPLAKLAADCASLPVCQREVVAVVHGALGKVMTDAQGHAQTPQVAAGRYYLVGVSNIQGKPLIWAQPVNVQPGANVVTLDQLNGRSPP